MKILPRMRPRVRVVQVNGHMDVAHHLEAELGREDTGVALTFLQGMSACTVPHTVQSETPKTAMMYKTPERPRDDHTDIPQ